jgi:ADP-heptose:LPS heptosyltransferase
VLTYWHVDAPEDHVVTRWLSAALAADHQGWRTSEDDLLSWNAGAPGEGVRWRRFPDLREGQHPSTEALRAAAEPDRAVMLRPDGVPGAAVETASGDTAWRWLGAAPEPASEALTLAAPERPWPQPEPGRIAFLGGASLVGDWTSARVLGEAVRAACPGWTTDLLVDAPALSRAWTADRGRQNEYPRPVEIRPTGAEVVVLLEPGLEWGPVLLEAARVGRTTVVREDAEYAGLIEPAGAVGWDGTAGGLIRALQRRDADPAAAEIHRRRGQAWSRRWTPERSLEKLRGQAFGIRHSAFGIREFPGRSRARRRSDIQERGASADTRRPRRWTLRREVGIGDVIFTLVVGAELKRRDPDCRLTVHTAPGHAEWVSWFPFVDRVTSGPFQPDPSETVGDFETHFPMGSRKDRSVALGEQIGAPPREWLAPPQMPGDLRERAEELLGGLARPRIAFVPVARDRSPARSLPAAAARELARGLAELGGVVWLEERAADEIPDGVLDLSGKCVLAETFAVLDACDLCVSVDSGLLYAAAALGKPVVGIFSHIGALQRLWLAPHFIALEPALPCAPCGETSGALHCRSGVEPAGPFRLPCVDVAPVGTVLEAAHRLLTASGTTREFWSVGPGSERVRLSLRDIPVPWERTGER